MSPAPPPVTWRQWDSADGFAEGYTSSVAPAGKGYIWVKHGSLGPVDRLDGYSAQRFPDPKRGGELAGSPGGAVWMWAGGEIKRLLPGRSDWESWKVAEVSSYGEERGNFRTSWDVVSHASADLRGTIAVVPQDDSHALILLPDRVFEFESAHASVREVLSLRASGLKRLNAITRGLGGSVIVAGRGGWGRLTPGEAGAWNWKALPRPPAVFAEFENPLELEGQSLFLTGVTGDRTATALMFDPGAPDGSGFRTLWRGRDRVVRAWPGSQGAVWVQDGNNLQRLSAGVWHVAEKKGALSGLVLNVMAEGPDRFWVATSQGLMHATPSLWSPPAGAPAVDEVVSSVTEDPAGRLWFLSAHSLLRLDHGRWDSWPLPRGETAWAIFSEGLQPLPDGRVVIRVLGDHLLIFDPASGRFRAVTGPDGRTLRMVSSAPGGRVIVETLGSGSSDSRLELFDGTRFIPMGAVHGVTDLRSVQITTTGEIYAGGVSGLGVWRKGSFRAFTAADGFTDPGAFAVRVSGRRVLAGGRDGLFELRDGHWNLLQSGLDRVRRIIVARDGTVWAAAGTGVYRCGEGGCAASGEEEGLGSAVAYSVFEDSSGRIWAGTTRGLSLFNPSADGDPPAVRLDGDLNPREAPPNGRIMLVFSGEDKWKLTPPGRLLYSWRLDGGPWSVFAPHNSTALSGLTRGGHSFAVRVMDRNGNVSTASASHSFSVLVPWYATPGFRAVAVLFGLLLLASCAGGFYSYRQRGLLIEALNARGKLERDRQKILRMIADRDSLPAVRTAIARAVAENSGGAMCLLVVEDRGTRECYCEPGPRDEALIAHIRAAEALPGDDTGWSALIGEASQGQPAPDLLLKPLSPTAGESGAIILLLNGRTGSRDQCLSVIETFADLAAAAAESSRLYRELAFQARHDSLTGLPNRICFEEELRTLVSRSAPLALFYIDLDHFKQINDTLGHDVGDSFLQQVARRFSGVLSRSGRLFRIGGDEFIVLARVEGPEAAERIAESLLESLGWAVNADGHQLFAGASIGVSLFPRDGTTPVELQKNADIAMYEAKARGRNGWQFVRPGMREQATCTLGLEQRLRAALETGGFTLRYQPQFSASGRTAGFEALLRLANPGGGVTEAGEFIRVAEDSGLMVPIGRWVLREVCRQIAEWRFESVEAAPVSINVSRAEISRPSFASEVETVLRETGVPAASIRFELTESALTGNLEECGEQMKRLHALGVRFSIDDFGTGCSSFAWLRRLPIDAMKIDRSFLSGEGGSEQNPLLMQALVALGRSLRLTLIAEGVETPEQLGTARSLLDGENDSLQGYLLSRPLSPDAARALLAPQFAKLGCLSATTEASVSIAAEHSSVVTS